MKYRVTKRGWVVISALVVATLVTLLVLISPLLSSKDNSHNELESSSSDTEEKFMLPLSLVSISLPSLMFGRP